MGTFTHHFKFPVLKNTNRSPVKTETKNNAGEMLATFNRLKQLNVLVPAPSGELLYIGGK